VDTNRQIYQVMLQRVKESTITSALRAANVRVIDPAKIPLHPFKPSLPMNGGAGFLSGLLLAIVGVIIRSKTNGTVQEPGEAEKLLGIPELGVIPAADLGLAGSPKPRGLFVGKSKQNGPSTQLISLSSKSPIVADSFRAVLASILFAGARQRQRVLVITSASPGEGKTTTACNLAVAFANLGRKVLLIDADTRNPHVHGIFGLENSTGLTTTLKHVAVNETRKGAFVRETSVPNLHVLTSGPAMQDGADLLFSSSMPNLIARYRDEYEMVLIDTPPMMVMPDARILGSFADGVVLIASAGKTDRIAIQAAYRRFVEDRTPVLGIVLNNWNVKTSLHNYYGAYKEPVTEQALVKVAPKVISI
jgi:capsular exopolysaccharide synthesis family protein